MFTILPEGTSLCHCFGQCIRHDAGPPCQRHRLEVHLVHATNRDGKVQRFQQTRHIFRTDTAPTTEQDPLLASKHIWQTICQITVLQCLLQKALIEALVKRPLLRFPQHDRDSRHTASHPLIEDAGRAGLQQAHICVVWLERFCRAAVVHVAMHEPKTCLPRNI